MKISLTTLIVDCPAMAFATDPASLPDMNTNAPASSASSSNAGLRLVAGLAIVVFKNS